MKIAKVENNPNLVRDLNTKAVLSTDVAALNSHLKRRKQFYKIDSMESRINSIENKMDDILKLLISIANNKIG